MQKNIFNFNKFEKDEINRKVEEALSQKKVLNLKNDAVFKSFFSKDTKESKHCLKRFLEAVTTENIVEIEVKNSEVTPEFFGAKFPRLDIHCKFENNEANIEMQMSNIDDQKKRSLFYASQLYASTLDSGESYKSIPKVFQIMVTNFNAFKDEKMHHNFMMTDEKLILTDSMQIHFLELTKLEKIKNQLFEDFEKKQNLDYLTDVEFWTLIIAFADNTELRNILSTIEKFKEDLIMADSLLMTMSSNRDEWELQYGWEKYNRDKLAYIKASRDEGMAEGIGIGEKNIISKMTELFSSGISFEEALKMLK